MTEVRRARTGDAAGIAAIEVETWRSTYAGILPDRTLVGMSVERKAQQWACELRDGGVWVWEDGRLDLLGFGHCGPARLPATGCEGEVTTLYVHPDAQGRGIGRALVRAMFADLRGHGMDSAVVWVLEGNPSRFFYARMGGQLRWRRPIGVGGREVPALGFCWMDLAAALAG
ncbi:MAG: GNAT family N-acetyltransferase [Magnetospirillum sp.]|nr:GNAT family N-acetyltransferase [Magnetospirillum sp.]